MSPPAATGAARADRAPDALDPAPALGHDGSAGGSAGAQQIKNRSGAMGAAVRVHKVGGREVLTYEEIEVPGPSPGQIRVKPHACGLNSFDTYCRMGMYPSPVG